MIKYIFIFIIFTINLASANQLKPFVTDFCTMFADGTPSQPTLWRHCCVEHDLHYWYGGSDKDQDEADLKLKACVDEVAGGTWANLIYIGVRAGHYSPIKNAHKWSWGWEAHRENKEICEQEKLYVIEELRKLSLDVELIEKYIKNNFKSLEQDQKS